MSARNFQRISTTPVCSAPVPPYVAQGDERERLSRYRSLGDPVFVPGPTGCGKTVLIHEVYGPDLIEIVADASLTAADLVGRLTSVGGETVWTDGPLTVAVREGRPFVFDEISELLDASVLTVLHGLLDHRRTLYIPGRSTQYKAAPGFVFVASYNPQYSRAAQTLTPALRQRCRFVEVDYLAPLQEAELLRGRIGISADDAQFLAQLAAVTRKQAGHLLKEGASTRLLLNAAVDLKAGISRESAVSQTLLPPLTDDKLTRQTLMQSFQAAGLFSTEEWRRLESHVPEVSIKPVGDDDFFDGGAPDSES